MFPIQRDLRSSRCSLRERAETTSSQHLSRSCRCPLVDQNEQRGNLRSNFAKLVPQCGRVISTWDPVAVFMPGQVAVFTSAPKAVCQLVQAAASQLARVEASRSALAAASQSALVGAFRSVLVGAFPLAQAAVFRSAQAAVSARGLAAECTWGLAIIHIEAISRPGQYSSMN
jgi:hypothetical protein